MPADLGPPGEAGAEQPEGPRSDDGPLQPLNGEVPSTSDPAASGPPADGGSDPDAALKASAAAFDNRITAVERDLEATLAVLDAYLDGRIDDAALKAALRDTGIRSRRGARGLGGLPRRLGRLPRRRGAQGHARRGRTGSPRHAGAGGGRRGRFRWSGRPCRIAAGAVVAGGQRRSKRCDLLDRASGRPGLACCCGESPARARQQWPRSGGCSPTPSACPRVPSATFAGTVTTIQRRVDREADVLVVIDDPASYSLVVTGCRCAW
jgi:hypothetical protein